MTGAKTISCKRLLQARRHPLQTLLSVLILALIGWVVWSTGAWLIIGADWSVVTENLPLFAAGSYPENERWRPLLWLGLLCLMTAATLLQPLIYSPWRISGLALSWCWLAMLPLGLLLLAGGAGLQAVSSRDWGGAHANAHPHRLQRTSSSAAWHPPGPGAQKPTLTPTPSMSLLYRWNESRAFDCRALLQTAASPTVSSG